VIASPSDASNTAEWARLDVSDYAAVEALAHDVRKSYGGTNILVNNAAAGGEPGGLDTADPSAARRLFEVNVTGVFNGIRAFAADLKAQAAAGRPAHILNVGSEHCLGVPPHVMPISTYTVSKYATLAFTDTARRDFAGTGLNVSLLAPAWILTERVAQLTEQSLQAAATHGGILVLRPEDHSLPQVKATLERLLQDVTLDELVGCVSVFRQGSLRIRRPRDD
jgi:NAD(P)-dependent dehydrogenase (short-subunit alcohol dehydrogenase family)